MMNFVSSLQKEEGDDNKTKEEVMEYVRAIFKPEFLNRLDEIIMFHKLSRHNIHDIVKIQLEHLKEILAKQNIILEIDEAAINYLTDKGYDPMFGARPLKRLIQREIQNNFARLILAGEVQNGDIINISSDDKELIIKKA